MSPEVLTFDPSILSPERSNEHANDNFDNRNPEQGSESGVVDPDAGMKGEIVVESRLDQIRRERGGEEDEWGRDSDGSKNYFNGTELLDGSGISITKQVEGSCTPAEIYEHHKFLEYLKGDSTEAFIVSWTEQTAEGEILKVSAATKDEHGLISYENWIYKPRLEKVEEKEDDHLPDDLSDSLLDTSELNFIETNAGESVLASPAEVQIGLRGERVGATEAVGEEVDMEDEEDVLVEMGAETSVDAPIREALERLFAEEDQIPVLSESSPIADRMEGLVRGLFLDSEVGAIPSEMQMKSAAHAPRNSFVETAPVASAAVVAKVKDSVQPVPKRASFQEVSGVAEAIPVPDKGPDITPTNSPEEVEMIVQPQYDSLEKNGVVEDDAAPVVIPDQIFIPKQDVSKAEIKDIQSKDENVKPEPTEDRVDVVTAEVISLQDEIETVADTDSQKKETDEVDAVEVVAGVSAEVSPLLSSEKDLPEKVDVVQVATRVSVERAPAPESSVIAKTPDARKVVEPPVAPTGIRLVRIESNQAPELTNFDARVVMGESRTESGKIEIEKVIANKEIGIAAADARIESGEVLRRIGMLSTTANLSDGIETMNSEAANLKAANDNATIIGTRHGITLRRAGRSESLQSAVMSIAA